MTAQELHNAIYYDGQARAMRQACIDRKLIPIEKLAIMNTLEVCDVVSKHFVLLGIRDGGETILLVEKDKWSEANKYIVPLHR